MRLKHRLLTVLLSGTLSVGMLAALPSSAVAAEVPVETMVDFQVSEKVGEYSANLSLYITGSVSTVLPQNGSTNVYAGTAYLQRKAAGKKNWKTVGVDESPNSLWFDGLQYKGNATYRVVYEGATYDSYPDDFVYGDSQSQTVKVKTYRHMSSLNVYGKKLPTLKIRATPGFGGKTFKAQVKKNGKWKPYKKAKANKKGQATMSFAYPKSGRIYYRVVASGNKKFIGSTYTFYTYNIYNP